MAPYLPLVAVLLAGGSVLAGLVSVGSRSAPSPSALWVALRHGHRAQPGISHTSDEVVLLTVVGLLLDRRRRRRAWQLSGAVVAFLVGLAISGALAERARQLLRAAARPVRGALLRALRAAGRRPRASLGCSPWRPSLLCVVTALTKMATGWVATRKTSGVPGRLRAGTALVARGEFCIVIAGLAVAAGSESVLGRPGRDLRAHHRGRRPAAHALRREISRLAVRAAPAPLTRPARCLSRPRARTSASRSADARSPCPAAAPAARGPWA